LLHPRLRVLAGWKGTLGILLLCTTVASPNAHSNTNTTASTKSPGTVSAVSVQQSVFIMPKGKQDGVDPFFPKSTRPYNIFTPIIASTPEPVTVAVDLKLKAISGLPEHRLALINNHTFESGEEGEVLTDKGRIRIRCLEITQDSAVVQVG